MVTLQHSPLGDLNWYQAVTDNWFLIQNNLIDVFTLAAKGSLIAASGPSTPENLTVGVDGQTLIAASSQPSGLQWAPGPAGSAPLVSAIGAFRTDRVSVRGQARAIDVDNGRGFAMAKARPGSTATSYSCLSNIQVQMFLAFSTEGTDPNDTTLGMAMKMNSASGGVTSAKLGYSSASPFVQRTWSPFFHLRMKTDSTLTNHRDWVGFFSGDPSASDTPTLHLMGFRFSQGVDTNWQCCTMDGTTMNVINSGVAVAASTIYTLEIQTDSSGDVEFYINNSLVATSTAHLPGLTTSMNTIGLMSRDKGTGGVSIVWSDAYASQD